jgi:hypothetical protein
VDVRIGISESPREVTVEIPDDERADAVAKIEAALTHAVEILWLTDKKGKQVAITAAKIAYVEIGTADGDRRMGFGS